MTHTACCIGLHRTLVACKHSVAAINAQAAAMTEHVRCAQVADFGLSKVTLSGVARTDGWEGQAHYLAPECLDSEARLASDVVSRFRNCRKSAWHVPQPHRCTGYHCRGR